MIMFSTLMWLISLAGMLYTKDYREKLLDTELVGSPLATNKLDLLYLPPMVKMQDFVLGFTSLVLCYYLYQLPIWDGLKSSVPAL